MVTFDDFKKMELKVAEVKGVNDHPNADKLYILTVELGGELREIVAGIKEHYRPEELLGKRIVVVANLEPATIRGIESKGMLLAAQADVGVSILTTDRPVKPGSPVR